MTRTNIERWLRLRSRAILLLGALAMATAASGLLACSQPATKTAEAEKPTQAATDMAESREEERSSGDFDLALAGDQEAGLKGTASCVLDEPTETLRATLDSHGASDFLYYVTVPDYDDDSNEYDGTFEMSGGERSSGPVSIGITRETDNTGFWERQLTIAFEGTYDGAAGTGTVKGEVHCGLPAAGNADGADEAAAGSGS